MLVFTFVFFSVSKDRRDWLVEQRHLSKPWMCQNLPFSISLVVKSISFCWLSWSSRQTYACPKNSSGFMWIFWILIENSGVSLISSWGINLTSISMLVYALCSTDRWDVLECKNQANKMSRRYKNQACNLYVAFFNVLMQESGECPRHVFNVLILFRWNLEARGMPGQASQDAPLPTAASAKQRHRRGSRVESWKV